MFYVKLFLFAIKHFENLWLKNLNSWSYRSQTIYTVFRSQLNGCIWINLIPGANSYMRSACDRATEKSRGKILLEPRAQKQKLKEKQYGWDAFEIPKSINAEWILRKPKVTCF